MASNHSQGNARHIHGVWKIGTSPNLLTMEITNVRDLLPIARRRLPGMCYAYISNGGFEQETLRWNIEDLDRFALMPHVLNDVSHRSTQVKLSSHDATMPVALAPVGACGIAYPNGEIEAALAAKDHGVPFTLSTLSICTLEDVAEAVQSPFWFQLYWFKDRDVSEGLIKRAADCNCSTLILSLDCHVRSERYPEQKMGLLAPPRIDAGTISDALFHPRWLFSMIRSKRRTFGNLIGLYENANSVAKTTEWLEGQFDASITAETIQYIRRLWPRQFFVKGVLHPIEARKCIEAGADGVIISNHGGRQADGVCSTCAALPWAVEEVGGRGQVLVDGGIRSGVDVLKMMALGANGCLIGRAYMYGLGAMGRKGVEKVLDIIHKELDLNMGLCGVSDINALPPGLCVERTSLLTGIGNGQAPRSNKGGMAFLR